MEDEVKPLYWESSYEIALSLIRYYPDFDVEKVGIAQLAEMVIRLPGFSDDPAMANDAILTDILREWYEETNGS